MLLRRKSVVVEVLGLWMICLVLSFLYISLVVRTAVAACSVGSATGSGYGQPLFRATNFSESQRWSVLPGDLLSRQCCSGTDSIVAIMDIATRIASFSERHVWYSNITNTFRLGSDIYPTITTQRTKKRIMNRAHTPVSTVSRHLSAGKTTPKTTMLRIQREWKDMIRSGVAFDWYNGEPIKRRDTSANGSHSAISANTSSHIWIGPLNFRQWYVWHFTFTGIDDGASSRKVSQSVRDTTANPYSNGVYHGRIILPKTYPMNPPQIQLLTPNGRYSIGQDICLSVSNYHPETWQLSMWNIVSIIESLRYHMMTSNIQNEIGTIQPPVSFEQKQRYADQSRKWKLMIRIPDHPVYKRSSTFSRKRKNFILIDHHRMIEERWISTNLCHPINDTNTYSTVVHRQSMLCDDVVMDENKVSNQGTTMKRHQKQGSSSSVTIHKTQRRNKKQVTTCCTSLVELFYVNVCRIFFTYPWITVGLLGMLFLYLNIAVS